MATKDYAAIAKARITQPSESKRMPRVLVYGRNKKGKTRFSATAPNVLIVDPEEGTDHETKINPNTWKVNDWTDLNDVYMFLKGGGVSPITGQPYRWVSLDGMTRITNMSLRWTMNQEEERSLDRKPGQVGKQDYGKSGEMVKGMLLNFHSLRDIGVILTAQERMREVEAPSEEDEDAGDTSYIFVPDLPAGVRSAVNSMVDVIGRMYTVRGEFPKKFKKPDGTVVTKNVDGVHRRLWIGPHNSYDTGYRSEFILPDYITEPSVPRLLQAMREGKV
jgi:hypothetical protein